MLSRQHAHARELLAQLAQQPLSTRELKRLYAHYRAATQRQRERLVENPGLFLRALESREEQIADQRLAEGPEGAWCKDLAVITQLLKRVLRHVPTLFAPEQDPVECARLRQAFAPTKTQFQRLEQALAEAREP